MIGNLSRFWRVTRELDLGRLRDDFERASTIAVVGSDWATAEAVGRVIDPSAIGTAVLLSTLREWRAPGRFGAAEVDIYVLALGERPDPEARRAIGDISRLGVPLLLVQLGRTDDLLVVGIPEERIVPLDLEDRAKREQLVRALIDVAPDAMLSLARRNPSLREAVATRLIRQAARANAQFAAMSAIPASIPVIGTLVGTAADTVVLTKNQVMLIFKLAGIYGRDVALSQQLLTEILPVVGGAFLWRSAARTLVGLVPGPISVLPKTAIAYTGTYLTGETARYYYAYGRKPPREALDQFRREGQRLARTALARLRPNRPRKTLAPPASAGEPADPTAR